MVLARIHVTHRRRRRFQQQQDQGDHPGLNEALEAENALTQEILEENEKQPFDVQKQQKGLIPMNGNSTSTKEGNQETTESETAAEEGNNDSIDKNNVVDEDTLLAETPVVVKNEVASAEGGISTEHGILSEQDAASKPHKYDAIRSTGNETYGESLNHTDISESSMLDNSVVDKNGTAADPMNREEDTAAEKMKLEKDSALSGYPTKNNSTIKDPTINISTPPSSTAFNASPDHSSSPLQHPLAPSSSHQHQGGGYGDFFLHYVAVLIAIVILLLWARRLRQRYFQSAQPEEPRREGYQFV